MILLCLYTSLIMLQSSCYVVWLNLVYFIFWFWLILSSLHLLEYIFSPSSFISVYIQWKINKYVLTCWNNSFLSLLLSTFTLSFPKAFCWSTFIPFIRCAHVPIVQRFTYWFDRTSQWKIFLKHTVLMMIRDVTQYVSACCCLTLAVFTVIWLGAMGLSPSLISPPRP